MLAINPEEVKGIDYFDEEISKNDAKQKIYKLNIGEFIIFKATISNEDIVLASGIQQETGKIIKVIENETEIDEIHDNGIWYVTQNPIILRQIASNNFQLYLKVMQEPWPYSLVFKKLISLAGPIFLIRATASIDQFMAGKFLSDAEKFQPGALAASNLILSSQGFLTFISTAFFYPQKIMIARFQKQNNKEEIARTYQSAYILATIISTLPMAAMYWSKGIFEMANQNSELSEISQDFYRSFMIGFPAIVYYSVDRQLSFALEKTTPPLLVSCLGLGVSGFFGYAFTNGKFGFPTLNARGQGYALAIEAWFNFLLYKAYLLLSKEMHEYRLYKPQMKYLTRLWALFREGFPVSLQLGIELGSILGFALIVGHLYNKEASAALQIAFNYIFLEAIPLFSLGQATAILVAKADELKLHKTMRRLGTIGMLNAAGIAGLILIPLSICPSPLTNFFLREESSSSDQTEIHKLTNYILPIMGAGQVFDAVRNTQMGILRANYDSWYSTGISFITLLVTFLPFAYIFGKTLGFDLPGMSTVFSSCIALSLMLITPRCLSYLNDPQVFREKKKSLENKFKNCYATFFQSTVAEERPLAPTSSNENQQLAISIN